MNCRDAETLLDGFFDGELDDEKMREAALHVARCGSCDAAIAEREKGEAALSSCSAEREHCVGAGSGRGGAAWFSCSSGARESTAWLLTNTLTNPHTARCTSGPWL